MIKKFLERQLKGKTRRQKIALIIMAVFGIAGLVSEYVYRGDLGENTSSHQIIKECNRALRENVGSPAYFSIDISSKVKEIIPIGSDRDWAVRLLEEGSSFIVEKSKGNPTPIRVIDKDEVLWARRDADLFFSFVSSHACSVVLFIKNKKVIELHGIAIKNPIEFL